MDGSLRGRGYFFLRSRGNNGHGGRPPPPVAQILDRGRQVLKGVGVLPQQVGELPEPTIQLLGGVQDPVPIVCKAKK